MHALGSRTSVNGTDVCATTPCDPNVQSCRLIASINATTHQTYYVPLCGLCRGGFSRPVGSQCEDIRSVCPAGTAAVTPRSLQDDLDEALHANNAGFVAYLMAANDVLSYTVLSLTDIVNVESFLIAASKVRRSSSRQ